MNLEKMKAVCADKEFVKSLFEMETAAEVQAALKEKGVEVTEQEILAVRDILAKVESGDISVKQLESGELPEEMLEHVAGGLAIGWVFLIIAGIAGVGGTGIGLTITDSW
jgi:hypothetical protein